MPETQPLPELKLLLLFDCLYDTRSVTRAAERLGHRQPTVSIWLARLREQLRDPLFVGTLQGMQPTPRADAPIGQTREVIEALRRLLAWESDFNPATARRRFRICMTDASHITLLPQLLAHVRALAPQVRLEAARIDAHTALALESGEADLAVGCAPWLASGIYQQTLFPQDWVCLVNPAHPRISKALSLRRYEAEAHNANAAGTGQQLLEDALAKHQVRRHVLLELPGFLGLGPIVSTTDLIVTLPRHIGETLARLSRLAVFACPLAVPPSTSSSTGTRAITTTPATAGCAACWRACSCAGRRACVGATALATAPARHSLVVLRRSRPAPSPHAPRALDAAQGRRAGFTARSPQTPMPCLRC